MQSIRASHDSHTETDTLVSDPTLDAGLGAVAQKGSRVTEATLLAALEGGRGGSFQREQPSSVVIDGINMRSRRWTVA
jgi:hypothetical protein